MATAFYGFDVSQWNGVVDMAKAKKSGKDYVIVRSSYGNVAAYPSQKDRKFDINIKNARAAGLAFGVYHYCYATSASGARAEAEGFVKLLNTIKPIPYFVALDIEDAVQAKLSAEKLQEIVKAFIDVVEGAGFFCALYSYEAFLARLPASFRSRYAIWCANISRAPSIACGVHQYSFKGSVSGCSGDTDLNRATVDYPAIIKSAGLNGYTKTKPEPTPAPKGDVNGDGKLDVSDVTAIAAQVKGVKPLKDSAAGDVNGDGKVDSADVTEAAARVKGNK